MGNIETTTKFSRLKCISSTEDNYLEAKTGGVLKKLFLKNSQYLLENKSVEVTFNKVRPAILLEKRLQHRCIPVHVANFLRTPILKNICGRLLLIAFFYYSNLIAFDCLFTVNYDLLWWIKCSLKLDYVIQ